MLLNRNLRSSCEFCLRYLSKSPTNLKVQVLPDEYVLQEISNEVYKPRKHPGVMKTRCVEMPKTFVEATINAIEDYPIKVLLETGDKLSPHLKGRVPPMEADELTEIINKVHQNVVSKFKDAEISSEEDEKRYKQKIKDKVDNILRKKIYNWKPIKYQVMNSLAYLIERSPPEYSVLVKIFGEIFARDPNLKPRSLFDFGSGVGTVTWAANLYWKKSIFEYFNVDISPNMNDLAHILLQGGRGNAPPVLKGVFYRQFLPASHIEYDLVVSAYSMLELPSSEARLETVLNLWNKTQNYLIIIEHGTNAGFKVVNEIRDFILNIDDEKNKGHVFSPCPNDLACPRFVADDGTPCSFETSYYTLPIGRKSEVRKELYSYVVLKKGSRPEGDPWPRIIRPTLIRSKHAICRVCTLAGKLDEVIFTSKKHGKSLYHCARSSKWGDLLPVTLKEENTDNVSDSNNYETK